MEIVHVTPEDFNNAPELNNIISINGFEDAESEEFDFDFDYDPNEMYFALHGRQAV
ncbi:MAG TPA: hypothetical protein VGB50_01170 [Flavobacterium sp.]|jgi:hypothetical protein